MSGTEPTPKSGRGPLFWILVVGAALLFCCGGIGAALWFGAREWIGIVTAPPAERAELLSKKLESMAGDQMRTVDAFDAAIDAGRTDEAWEMTSAGFRAATPREKFDELAALIPRVMGPLASRSLVNVQTKHVVGALSVTSLTLKGVFEKGEGTILFELEQDGGAWKVRTWRVESPLFLDAMTRGAGK